MTTSTSKTSIRPSVLTIAGNDSAGMAGLAMDIRTQTALGVHTLSVISANTAQNNHSVLAINAVDDRVFRSQLEALTLMKVKAIKVGLLVNQSQVLNTLEQVKCMAAPFVFDPVLNATSGAAWSDEGLLETLKSQLLPACDLLTPNIPETEKFLGIRIENAGDIECAAKTLLSMGCKAVLIKGGHLKSDWSQDYFRSADHAFWLSSKRIETVNARGTGCALASSIAAALALGYPLCDAVVIGKMAINQGLRLGYAAESCSGPVSIQTFPNQFVDLPYLTDSAGFDFYRESFAPCNQTPLALYPVVDSADWLRRLLPLGVTTAQLRIKHLAGEKLEKEILDAIQFGRQFGCRLFINDHWQLAIKHSAYGVHLGQEDLEQADIAAIHQAGLRLGISTHCHYEVAKAHRYKPSYIACGPVFHTNSKQMHWIPQGITGLQYWRDALNYPLVAIGGINQERFVKVAKTGVDGIAMITAITEADNPETTATWFMQQFQGSSER